MQYGIRTWSQILQKRGEPSRIPLLLHVAEILEEHNMNLLTMCQLKNYHLPPNTSQQLITYYETLQNSTHNLRYTSNHRITLTTL